MKFYKRYDVVLTFYIHTQIAKIWKFGDNNKRIEKGNLQ